MKPRLSRPLVTAIVSGALVAGGSVYASPVMAAPAGGGDSNSYRTAAPAEAPDTTGTSASSASSAEAAGTVGSTGSVGSLADEPAPVGTTPATPDTVKPAGAFRLNTGALWIGQKVVFGQNPNEYGDNVDADASITRKISWGDGTTTTLAAGATSFTKQYTKAGRFNVTETLTDRSGNSFTTAAKAVSVTVPGKYSLSKYTVYQGALFNVKLSSIPAGTTKMKLDWGDGWVQDLSGKNQTQRGLILYRKNTNSKISGKVTLKVQLFNKYGATSWINVGTTNVLKDSWKPKVTVTKPKKANRISSWKTVKGTVSDKGSGVRFVGVTVVRITTSGKYYCLTPKKKWKRYTTEAQLLKHCANGKNVAKVSKGKWSLKVPAGVTKGKIVVLPWVYDYANNYKDTYREAKLTRK
ncbi:hypothetical protein AB0F72_26940 [Actinoplanes sp. NPDC023936]|uniref:hypothetical protein n=1 Tax=Actinoplanes sp. NPDC023936 TaxID=3154910 RepID=UPI0033D4C4D6